MKPVALRKLVAPVRTWNPTSSTSDDVFQYIDLSAVDQKEKTITGSREVSCIAAPSRARQIVARNDVLVSTVRPNLNGVAVVPPHLDGAIASTGFCVLRPQSSKLDERFLFQWVKTPQFVREMVKLATGASYPAVSDRIILDSQIPLPPLEEQKRIAAILDKADAIRHKRQEAIRLTDDFLRSVFLDMFGDPVLNNKRFPSGTIRDLVASVSYGTSQKAHITDGKYAVLRMNNISSAGGWSFEDLKYVDLEEHSAYKYLVHKGQMLFNRTNSKELVGKTAVYREVTPIAFAGYLVRAIARGNADAEYISAYLNSAHGKTVLRGMCKSIVGMANINAQELLSIPISIPPADLQKQFGNIVRGVYSKSHTHRLASQTASDLFASLQQRAFRGEL